MVINSKFGCGHSSMRISGAATLCPLQCAGWPSGLPAWQAAGIFKCAADAHHELALMG
jgi:hypothetical protein